MSWWQTLLIGGGGAGGAGGLMKILKHKRFRKMAAEVIDPGSSISAVEELRTILEEQRKGYDHLAGRVTNLESTIADLERKLTEERNVAKNLRRQLSDERKLARTRIADLEKQLTAAEERIAHLEGLLDEIEVDKH